MTESGFDYAALYAKGLPTPAARFAGLPKYNFVGGHNDPTLIPTEDLAEAAAAVLRREGPSLALYSMAQGPQGYLGLRDFLVGKLARRRGIACSRDDILITGGSGPAIDLVNQVLLDPGDTVIMEEFTYGGAINKLRRAGINIVGTPLDADGIRMDALDALLTSLTARGVRPKYIYTTPTIQNPTGSILPLERRHQLLAIARAHGVPIFEDECYTDLVWNDAPTPPAMYGIDPGPVIHIGSFSKSLSPAIRVGYVLANWDVLSRLIACKTDSGTGALDQMITAEYCAQSFDPHIVTMTDALEDKLDTLIDALEREFGTAVECFRPKGGIYLWIKLPDQIDTTRLLKPAAAAGIAFTSGPEWGIDPEKSKPYMRLCFALPSKDMIREGIAALAQLCFEQTGIPVRGANIPRGKGV